MTAKLSIVPSDPAVGTGVLFTVTGPVIPDGAIVIVDDADKVRAKSVVFSQDVQADGTGPSVFVLDPDATSGEFQLYLYTDDDLYGYTDAEHFTTDDIYYYNDGAPNYLYPDGDDVADAIIDAMGDGTDVTWTKEGDVLTVLVGGKWSGKKVSMELGTETLTGAGGTLTVTRIDADGGPFVFGPIYFFDGDYTADVLIASGDDEGDSLLSSSTDFTVTA